MRKLFLFLMMSFILVPFPLLAGAQGRVTVTGSVKDAGDLPVVAATVFEQGTTNGTSTDAKGGFSLTLTKGSTLVVSCIGYETKEVKITDGKTHYDLVIKEDALSL